MKAFAEIRAAAQDLIEEIDAHDNEDTMSDAGKLRILQRAWPDWRRPGRFKVGDVVARQDWASEKDSGPGIVAEVYDQPIRNNPVGMGATDAVGFNQPLDIMVLFVRNGVVATGLCYSGELKPYEEEIAF